MNKVQGYLIFIANFLNFAGYYAFLVMLSNFGMIALSRSLTIPIRVLILACLFFILIIKREVYMNDHIRLFLVFAAIYIARILIELIGGKIFHIGTAEILLYFLAFAVLPLLALSSLKLTANDYKIIRSAILLSCLILSVLTLFNFHSLIGTVGRISEGLTRGENFISPLALSYCGTLGMGVGISYLLENKASVWNKLIVFATIFFSLVPFYLGSSRGSIFAFFVPFIIMFLCKRNTVAGMRIFFIMLVAGVIGVYLSEMFGSSIIDRFTNIESDVAKGNSSAVRLVMWKDGLEQFADHPIFGNSLEVDTFQFYPHNIIIEVLLSTGIIGFIPFLFLVIDGFRKAIRIFRDNPQDAWVGVIFVQSFIQNMFSGSLYGSSWIWFSLGLLYVYKFQILKKETARNTVLKNNLLAVNNY